MSILCNHCGHNYPEGETHCLVCGRPEPNPPGRYPNIQAAEDVNERAALVSRYSSAWQRATQRGIEKHLQEFEDAVKDNSQIVTACDLDRLNDLTEHEDAVYPVFINLVRANIRFPGDDQNNRDRIIAEEATFPNYSAVIRYAALTLNDDGLPNYGNYFLIWDTSKIEHRTSFLIGNCLTLRRRLNIALDDKNLPAGSRATWADKHLLAVAKCENLITPTTTPDQFGQILLQPGRTSDNDDFIEAHIWGPMTRATLYKVVFALPDSCSDPLDFTEMAFIAAMRARVSKCLNNLNVAIEVRLGS